MMLNIGAVLSVATSLVAAAMARLRPWWLSRPALTPALQACHFIAACMTSGLTLMWCSAHKSRALLTFKLLRRASKAELSSPLKVLGDQLVWWPQQSSSWDSAATCVVHLHRGVASDKSSISSHG